MLNAATSRRRLRIAPCMGLSRILTALSNALENTPGSSAEEGAIGTSNDAATNAPQAAQRANFFEPASNLVNILNILILQFCNVIPVLNEYSKTRVLRKRKTNKTRFFGE
jgi:hypothetical protein